MIRYHSTRGQAPVLNFDETVLAGLASDGGLYVPDSLPHFSPGELVALQGADYVTLATAVLWPFFEGSAVVQGREALGELLARSYAEFRHAAIAPLNQLAVDEYVLELFWGPTLAFKDFALQFLGNLLEKLLAERGERVTVLGATSGDTGSAAIAGCSGRGRMDIVILHPHGRVSPIQRLQMTTWESANVHNLAIEGSFDDCQHIVKTLFTDSALRAGRQLTAVNSINWARIMAQIVYYFYAALGLGAPARAVSFAVPTGNFGDIYAGYLAKRMGLPIDQLIIATNCNDILSRALADGGYRAKPVEPSLSPSMDIQVSSNFERLLFDVSGRDAAVVRQMMGQVAGGGFDLLEGWRTALARDFAAARCDDEQTRQTIAHVFQQSGQILDPHTAVGVFAGRAAWNKQSPLVVLGTAHPAKFPGAVKAAVGFEPPQPQPLAMLAGLTERFTVMPNDAAAVKAFVETL